MVCPTMLTYPHSDSQDFAIIHNGIIENCTEMKDTLLKKVIHLNQILHRGSCC